MNNRDIIVMGLQSWDIDIGSNCINIAREFAKKNRVLYVNRAVDRISWYRNRKDPKTIRRIQSVKGLAEDLVQVENNLWTLDPRIVQESINKLPGLLFRRFNKQNGKKLAGAIADACKRLKFSDPVLFVDNDFFRGVHLKEYLNPAFFIYYIRDFLHLQPYFKKHGRACEAAIMAKADLVVSNSSYLAAYAQQYNPDSYDIGQGCDFTYFSPDRTYEIPDDLKTIRQPVIGYVGTLVGFRLNIRLLETLAERRTDWSFVFVGPEDEDFMRSRLHQMKNVFFLGRKDESELAAYVSYFDVCMNPQLVNETTMGNYPRKIDEYLALGKPVVATYTDFMVSFEGYVFLCNNVDEYEQNIQMILQAPVNRETVEKRQRFALSHSWENAVLKMYNLYNTLTSNGKGR